MINKAIAKITNEMMEKNDALARLIEEHLTEKCTSIAVAEKILDPNKQLAAIHRMIWDAARKRKETAHSFRMQISTRLSLSITGSTRQHQGQQNSRRKSTPWICCRGWRRGR